MKDFFIKENYEFNDIASLIENEAEESIHLEFKDGRAIDRSESKKKEMSKDISAFANSDGGILIYGIIEREHKAKAINFINGNEYTKEWLEQVIISSIQRRISNLKIFAIRQDNDISKTVYLIKIPSSMDAPNISKDNRYYKRFNFESVQMEEYEVRQSYNRKLKTELSIENGSVREIKSDESAKATFICEAQIYNSGVISEFLYKVNILFENWHKSIVVTWDREKNYDYTVFDENRIKISAAGSIPIFSSETLNGVRFKLAVPINLEREIFDNLKAKIHLFYSSGEGQLESEFKGLLDQPKKNDGEESE